MAPGQTLQATALVHEAWLRLAARQREWENRTHFFAGRYKLIEKLGEGGCGVVYLAEQEEPVRRRVALKIIRM
jgi:hypothetical protein